MKQFVSERQYDRIQKTLVKKLLHHWHAIAVGELVDCRPMQPEDADRCFVDYRQGLRCHVYANVRPIQPFPFKGVQRRKKLPEDVVKQIRYL